MEKAGEKEDAKLFSDWAEEQGEKKEKLEEEVERKKDEENPYENPPPMPKDYTETDPLYK